MRNVLKKLAMSAFLPLLSLLLYWQRLHGDYSTYQLVLASSIAILIAVGLFLYASIARKVERGSIAWGFLLIVSMMVAAMGIIEMLGTGRPWGFPLFFLAMWIPIYHEICRVDQERTNAGLFKASSKTG
jgi:hypothetical protein